MPESKTSPRRIAAVEKQWKAVQLRKAGTPFELIAKELGYKSRQHAFYSVQAALRKILQEPSDELRTLDVQRLDTMIQQLWLFVVAPTVKAVPIGGGNVAMQVWDEAKFHAVTAVLRVMDRRAKLLGLDAKEPQPGSSREHPVWTQSVDAVDLSTATDPELDEIIEKAKAIQEAGRILKQA